MKLKKEKDTTAMTGWLHENGFKWLYYNRQAGRHAGRYIISFR